MKKFIALLFASTLLISCSENKKAYDPYESRSKEEISNRYEGGGADFHLTGWYSSQAGQIETKKVSDGIQVTYEKNVDFEYTNVYSTVIGRFADFNYINIKAKGTPGKAITLRAYYGSGENELANVLGEDAPFSLSSDFQVHSLKVKNVCKTKMDLLKKVCIFPEIGLANSSGDFIFSDVWFSKDKPSDGIWENEGVDSGDTSIRVNGWRTEGWTQYTLYALGSKTGVRYTKAAEYAFIEKNIEIGKGDNGLEFKFENLNSSVTCIRFLLRGDVERHVVDDGEYPYDVYYESLVYHYDLSERKIDPDTKESQEVQPDANGLTTLRFSIDSAIETIGEHHKNGYRLTLLIESHPEDDKYYKRYRNGEMIIHDMKSIYDVNFDLGGWTTEAWTNYQIYRENGRIAISYPQTRESGSIQKRIDINSGDNTLGFSFENVLAGGVQSISNMRLYLRGDFKEHVVPGGGKDEYDLYYEDELYAYNVNNPFEVQPNENNIITLSMPLIDALGTIAEHHKDGYFLKVFIESHADDGNDYEHCSGKLFYEGIKTSNQNWPEYNKWSTEEWTGYDIVYTIDGAGIKYESVGSDYAFVIRGMDIEENDNLLTLKFKNLLENDKPSVSAIRFLLRGDVKEHGEEYDTYYEGDIYQYYPTNPMDQPDENGIITLNTPLYPGLDAIGEHHENGYELKVYIESHPDDASLIESTSGALLITETSISYDPDVKRNMYSVDSTDSSQQTYTLSNKEDVDKNITYSNMPGNAYWPRIIRKVETTQQSGINIKIHNNGESSVLLKICAGILEDERSDDKNNHFYPLWDYRGVDGGGYYDNGQTIEIGADEDLELTISADRADLLESDHIEVITMCFDNIRGDSNLYSGDVDIVYVNVIEPIE